MQGKVGFDKVFRWSKIICERSENKNKHKYKMIYSYEGQFTYNKKVISDWDSSAIGVYYCGLLNASGLHPLYIGKGTGELGMRGRLLDHIRDDYWPDATHFGYHRCDTVGEAEKWEAEEIARYQPKYNVVGK